MDVWLRRAPLLGVGCIAFAIGIIGISWLWYGLSSNRAESGGQERARYAFSLESIGQGPLSLRPSQALGWIADLCGEIQVLAYNSRPDQALTEAQMVVHLKQKKERSVVSSGQVLYLEEKQGLSFSDSATPLWVKLTLLDGASVLVEASRRVDESEEKGQFVAHVQGMRSAMSLKIQESVKSLASAKAFTQDLVMAKYGGREFADWSRKITLELQGSAGGVYGICVMPGDYLALQEGEWKVVSLEAVQQAACMGQVVAASERGVDLLVWDEQGFSPSQFKVEVKNRAQHAMGPEMLPSLVRFRTGTQVSAVFGKRRLILRVGDWLVKRPNGWRHLRSTDEVQLYLERRLKGDLFVFEAIEKDPQGKYVLKGTLFDDSRLSMQPVSVPIHQERQHPGKFKRRGRGSQ
jgi:hypothetical protein